MDWKLLVYYPHLFSHHRIIQSPVYFFTFIRREITVQRKEQAETNAADIHMKKRNYKDIEVGQEENEENSCYEKWGWEFRT